MVSSGAKQIDPEATRGGWRQNDWKVKRGKQGTPPRVNLSGEFESRLPQRVTREIDDTTAAVRAPVRALKRLIPAEQRGAGRLIEKGQTIGTTTGNNRAAGPEPGVA